MPEADAEHGELARELSDLLDDGGVFLGVAGAVGEHDAVGMEGKSRLPAVVSAGTSMTWQPRCFLSSLTMLPLAPKSYKTTRLPSSGPLSRISCPRDGLDGILHLVALENGEIFEGLEG